MKNILNKIYNFNQTNIGKIILAFCNPIFIAWIICYLLFGIPLTEATIGIKTIIIVASLINGLSKILVLNENSDD